MKAGAGTIYKRGDTWWVQFYHCGAKFRESANTSKLPEARAFLKQKLSEAGSGKLLSTAARKTTLNKLAQLVFTDYRENEYDSLDRQKDAFNHLHEFFGKNCVPRKITDETDKDAKHSCFVEGIELRLSEYRAWREKQPNGLFTKNPKIGCSTATVNRELAALRRGFKLALKKKLVAVMPDIELAKERNRRTGFFEWHEFQAVCNQLPDYLKAPMTVAYYTGWRCASEIMTREKRHIIGDMLVLEPDEGKNEEPREFPLDVIPELRETIEKQLEATHRLEIETGRVIPLLFHNRGNPIVDYRPAWHKACAAAGLSGRIPHDFRRTAARNLIGAGVDPLTTMQLVGWKDMAMLKRYNIIDGAVLRRGVAKLGAYLEEQKAKPKRVVSFGHSLGTEPQSTGTKMGTIAEPSGAVGLG